MKILQNFSLEEPLAWAQLSHQKVHLVVATTGVCFANILMFLRSRVRSLSCFLTSPEISRHSGLRLIPKAQLLTFGISLSLEKLVFGTVASLEILPINYSLPSLHHSEIHLVVIHKK